MADNTGWWVYVLGPMMGAAIAVVIITAVRGRPDKEQLEAAQGDLPIHHGPPGGGASRVGLAQ